MPEETRTEFRVAFVSSEFPHGGITRSRIDTLAEARRWADVRRDDGKHSNVRIEQRTVTTTDWEPLDEGED